MNLSELGRSAFSLWWPGAALFAILLLYFLARPQKSTEGSRRQSVTQTSVAFLAYSILCLAIALSKHYLLATSHFVALALAMLAASSFLVGLYFEKSKPLMTMAGLMLLVTAGSASYSNWLPQYEGGFGPPKEVKLDVYNMTIQQLADEGEKIIFGGLGQSKVQGAIGKGQCPLCHGFQEGFLSERAPNLFGIPERAQERLNDPRYHLGKPEGRNTVQHEAFPGSGTAMNALEYIVESDVCHDCYVVAGFGIRGTHDTESAAPSSVEPIINLSIDEVIAVTTWLYMHSKEKPPSPGEIERAYKKFIPEPQWSRMLRARSVPPPPQGLLASGNEPLDELFRRFHCLSCHAIPGIGGKSYLAPTLILKTSGSKRIHDKHYKGKARTVREYAVESILYPSVYIPSPYEQYSPMPSDYGQQLTAIAIDRMADYLSQLEEGKAPPKID